jgi:hypothetical protein
MQGLTKMPIGLTTLCNRSEIITHAGQRVRIAIVWWSNADGPSNNYANDALDLDLDLKVKGPSGNYFPGSVSSRFDNNYELVDFVAPYSGLYTYYETFYQHNSFATHSVCLFNACTLAANGNTYANDSANIISQFLDHRLNDRLPRSQGWNS